MVTGLNRVTGRQGVHRTIARMASATAWLLGTCVVLFAARAAGADAVVVLVCSVVLGAVATFRYHRMITADEANACHARASVPGGAIGAARIDRVRRVVEVFMLFGIAPGLVLICPEWAPILAAVAGGVWYFAMSIAREASKRR